MPFLGSLVPWVIGSGSKRAAIHSSMPYSLAKTSASQWLAQQTRMQVRVIQTFMRIDPDVTGDLLTRRSWERLDILLFSHLILLLREWEGGLEHTRGTDEAVV